jgi:hypothetical protein
MKKMKKTIKILSISLLLISSKAFSQTSTDSPKKWGIETDLVQPFLPQVGIIRLTATRTITSPQRKAKGDLLLGMYIRPNVKHDVVEKINEYMAVIGYRQYFWKGLHLEAKANIGYAWGTKNLFDGKDYETSTLFWETNLGYKFNIVNKAHSSIYLLPQLGVIGNAKGENTVNIGPRGGKPDTFIQGGLTIGINF